MSEDYYYEEYLAGLHGLLQTIARAARLDKRMQRDSFRKIFGDEIGEWLIHVNIKDNEPRLQLLMKWVLGDTIKAYLRGRYTGSLVVSPQSRALMLELAARYRFDWLNLPKAISQEEQALKNLMKPYMGVKGH